MFVENSTLVLLGYTSETEPGARAPYLPFNDGNPFFKVGARFHVRHYCRDNHVEAVVLGHLVHAVTPHPNTQHTMTAVNGFAKRVAPKVGHENAALLSEFSSFVAHWLNSNLTPFNVYEHFDFEQWISTREGYTEARKQELRELYVTYQQPRDLSPEHNMCKSFIKDEFYTSFKTARTINSRTDAFKVVVGSVCSAMEKYVFKNPAFIKYVPVRERPSYIYDKLYRHGYSYFASDYSSLEASIDSKQMNAAEFQLYRHLFNLTINQPVIDLLIDAMEDEQVLNFKTFVGYVQTVRCSGEMVTSLGNGFTNLMIYQFICHKLGIDCNCVVEGDDGLGSCPPEFVDLIKSFPYDQLGFDIKIEFFTKVGEAGFCGNIFDEDDRVILVDPRKYLSNIGYLCSRYKRAKKSTLRSILRCKALSFLYQYEGCPIMTALSLKLLSFTSGHNLEKGLSAFDSYHRTIVIESIGFFGRGSPTTTREIGINSRLLMERRFGISIVEQVQIENELQALTDYMFFSGVNLPSVQAIMPSEWVRCYYKYVVRMDFDAQIREEGKA